MDGFKKKFESRNLVINCITGVESMIESRFSGLGRCVGVGTLTRCSEFSSFLICG